MKILNKIYLLGLLVAAFACFFPQNGYSKCDEKEIEASIKSTAKSKSQAAFSDLSRYNAAVNAYENSCGRIQNKGNPSHYPSKAVSSLLIIDQSLGATASASANFVNTGISWQALNPPSPECKSLANAAAQAQEQYNKSRAESIMALGVAAKDSEIPVSCVCPENSNEQQCVSYVQTDKETKSDDGCDSFPTYLASFSNCPLCPIFQTILDTNNRVATIAWNTMAKALQATVQIFFSVFLAIETLKIIANFSGAGLPSYLKSVLGLGLKVFIAYYLLSSSEYIYGMFISPIIKGGLDMGVTLMSSASNEASACFSTTSELSTSASGVFDASLLNGIMSAVRCFGTSAAIMPAVGRGLICHSWVPGEAIIPDFSMLLSGVLFLVTGLAIWLVVSFYLIDCTVQLGMVCTLVPFFIACWPFRISQTYTFKGLRLLMNSFFNYVMVGIIMLIGAAITSSAVGSENADMQTMIIAFNEDNLEMIKKLASLDSLALLVLVVCCVFAFRLIGKANSIAEKFSQGSGSSIGAKLGGVVAGVGASLAKTGLKAAEKIATAPADMQVKAQKVAIMAATGGAGGGGAAAGGAEAGAAGGAEGAGSAEQATKGNDIDTDKLKDQMDSNSEGDDDSDDDDNDYSLTSSADNPMDALTAGGSDTTDVNNENGDNPAADHDAPNNDNSMSGNDILGDISGAKPNTPDINKGNNELQNMASPAGAGGGAAAGGAGTPDSNVFTTKTDDGGTMQRIEDGNGNTTTTYTDKNGVLRSVVSDGADGSKDVKQYDENGKLDREYREDINGTHEKLYNNGKLTNDIKHGADGSMDVKQFNENGKLDREYHSDKNSSTERTYHENGQLKSERTNDVNGNGHYHSYKQDGSEDFKSEWKNDASMAAEFNNK